MEFRGSFVALVTPFSSEGAIDWKGWERLIEFQLSSGTHGLVPCGTTGETPTLTKEEKIQLIERAVQLAEGKVPVIAGTGSYSTRETVEMTKRAEQAGANAVLVVTPYYNKPTERGLYHHFEAIAKATSLPIVLYNVPGRTSLHLTPKVIQDLAQIDNVKAIKEASGSLSQVLEVLTTTDLTVLSGDDALTLPMLAVGGRGVISVAANVVPADMARLVDSYLEGHAEEAKKLALRMYPLFRALFYETNPIPVKKALELMGKIEGYLRLPLVPMSPDKAEALQEVMVNYGLLS